MKACELFDRSAQWLNGYEERCEQRRKEKGTIPDPWPWMLRRVQAEAAALLGVQLPEGKAKPKPVPEPMRPPK